MRLAMLLSIVGVLAAAPASAAVVSFKVGGTLSSVEYDFGGPASTTFLAGTPLGSPYQLNFSYDTASTPAFGGPAGGWYPGIVTASLTLDGLSFALGPTDVSVSGGPAAMNTRFGLFGNFALGQPTLNGFRPLDMHFDLIDATGQAFSGPALPSTLSLGDFDYSRLRIRFFGHQGETGLLFSVDSLTAGAVPEPGTWAMMIIGFGAVGACVRRRRGGKAPTLVA